MTRNSEFIKHDKCPKCGSRDNLAIYTDHEFCFGCKHYLPYGAQTKQRIQPQEKEIVSISLPYDSDIYIPEEAITWLSKYGITIPETISNRLMWSESRRLLIFPYFGESDTQLLGWQGRYFGDNPKHPKWFTKGYIKEFIKVINLQKAREHGIIYVEDIVSAIKVGRQYGACPIFGSFIPDTHSIRLHKLGVSNFLVWLDPDKYKEAHKFCVRIRNLGLPARVIKSDADPKEYTNEEIKHFVEGESIVE